MTFKLTSIKALLQQLDDRIDEVKERVVQLKDAAPANDEWVEADGDVTMTKAEKKVAFEEGIKHKYEMMKANVERSNVKSIIKNRGIYRRRPKKDRNPRVKKRLQYEKAVKKRNSQVQLYKGPKTGVYKGQETGISAGVIKSIKM